MAVKLLMLSLGYGCALAYYPIGTIGTVWVTSFGASFEMVQIARMLFFAALILVMIFWKNRDPYRTSRRTVALNGSFALVAMAFIGLWIVQSIGQPIMAVTLCALLLGAGLALPVLGWYEGFVNVWRNGGRGAAVAGVAAASLISAFLEPLGDLIVGTGPSALFCLLALTGCSWGCYIGARLTAPVNSEDMEAVPPSRGHPYHASLYMRVVLVAFGVTWAISFSLAAYLGFGQSFNDPASWGIFFSGIFVDAAIMAVFWGTRFSAFDHFGLTLRWITTIVGISWAIMPICAMRSAALCCFLCAEIYLLLMTCIILLNMELCIEHGLGITEVTTANFTLFFSGVAGGIVLFSVVCAGNQSQVTTLLASAGALVALMLALPYMPSRSSRAVDFARSKLPEDEGLDERLAHNRSLIAARFNLTAREAEMLELATAGFSREQIAQRLQVSPHTVKNHMTSLYGKLGVHSIRELNALVLDKSPQDDAPKP